MVPEAPRRSRKPEARSRRRGRADHGNWLEIYAISRKTVYAAGTPRAGRSGRTGRSQQTTARIPETDLLGSGKGDHQPASAGNGVRASFGKARQQDADYPWSLPFHRIGAEGQLSLVVERKTQGSHSGPKTTLCFPEARQRRLVCRLQGPFPHRRRHAYRSADDYRCRQPLSVAMPDCGTYRLRACPGGI